MSRPYQRLRSLMYEAGVGQPEVARALRLSVHTVSSKMNAHTDWTLSEMYRLMDLLGQPDEELHRLFTLNGRNEEVSRRCRKLG